MGGSPITRRALLRNGAAALVGAAALARAAAASAGEPSAAAWAKLRHALSGRLVRPSDAGYGAARVVYDLRFGSASPAAIAYCASSTDVQRAIDFCRGHGLAPIPRCGGQATAATRPAPG